jgi:lipoprotein
MKKFLSKRSILVGALALALGFIVSSCSRDKDDDAIYTAKLQVQYQGNNSINGSVTYRDANGNKRKIYLRSGMSENISFEVNKGFKSFVEVKATDIYGNLFVKWTVTKTYTGARVQNWSTSFTSYTGQRQSFTDSYKETVK